ncbi:MAG TPA: PepSY-like domain-containing protein, partial [Puia sp.]
LQAFKQTFPDAQQVKWAEQEDKYMVNFKQGEILTKIEYDKEGNFLSSLRYYTEKNLPVSILCRLQKKYGDKKVFGVTEMTTDTTVEYYIKLEDENNFITVRSNADGNMQIVEKYKKAS